LNISCFAHFVFPAVPPAYKSPEGETGLLSELSPLRLDESIGDVLAVPTHTYIHS
jgi:hypothetical protein